MNNPMCGIPPHPHHHHHGHPAFPFDRPSIPSYACCCCNTTNPVMKDYPAAGPFKGSAFTLKDAMPYLMDTTFMSYGQALPFAENIFTKFTKRNDPSCINLAARIDMTDTTLTNTVRFDFLKNYTARKYEELSGVLPIIKSGIKFRFHYTVTNADGGIEYKGHADATVPQTHFHFTSVKDVFVQSAQGLIIDNIPAMTYQGLYTITITHVEAFLDVINTKEHLQDASLNPFYTFTDNNTKIILHNSEIGNCYPDDSILIADCQVMQSFEYLANITTRLRLSFTAFTSVPIAAGDVSPMWFALNEPTEQTITQLRNEVSAMEEEIKALHAKDAAQDEEINTLKGQVELNRQNIVSLNLKISDLENDIHALQQDSADKDKVISKILERLDKLEGIPLALLKYKKGKKFQVGQLTWKDYGNIYQSTTDFIANGDINVDIDAGRLVGLKDQRINIIQ